MRGEHYNYFRDYDASTGRYIESDPIGLKGGPNTFTYVEAGPLQKSDVFGLATFMCTKPLHGLGPTWGPPLYSPGPLNPFFHQFLCVRDGQGNSSCGGQDRSGKAFGKGSAGQPSDDKWPSPGGGSCQLQDARQCVDNCTIRRITDKKRPWYGIPNGTDCQEWADEVIKDCKAECKGQQ